MTRPTSTFLSPNPVVAIACIENSIDQTLVGTNPNVISFGTTSVKKGNILGIGENSINVLARGIYPIQR